MHNKLVELYEEIYEEALAKGLTSDAAQVEAHTKVSHCKEIIEGVSFDLEEGYWANSDGYPVEEGSISADHFVEGSWYCGIRFSKLTGNISHWDELDDASKELALYNHGFDINMPWRVKVGYHPVPGTAPVYGEFVEGSERLDYEWIHSGKSSMEAIIEFEGITRGADHKRDLLNMSKQ